MARVIKCDLCGAESAPVVTENKELEKWGEVELSPMVRGHSLLHYDLCPICTDWLARTLRSRKFAGGYDGGRG